MAGIPNTGNLVDDIKSAVFDYYETYEYSISKNREKRGAKNGSPSPNFVMFEPKFSGRLTSWTASGKKKQTRIREDNFNAIYDKLGDRPDWFVLTVGVLDDSEQHKNPVGEGSISYGLLFDCLKVTGYDPLWPIRKNDFILKIERRMGDELLKAFSKKDYKTEDGKSAIRKIGKEIVEFVQLFIAGGRKPMLSAQTIRMRNWKENEHDVAYPNGLYEPLSETGQLEDAISYDVEYYQTLRSQKYLERKKNLRRIAEQRRKEKRKESAAKERIRKRETSAANLVANGKAAPRNIISEKIVEIEGLLSKVSERENWIQTINKNIKGGIIDEDHMSIVRGAKSMYEKEIAKYIGMALEISRKFGIPVEGL